MPDSIMPLLTHNNRLDLIDYWEAGQQGHITNRLGGEVSLTYLGEDSLSVSDTGVSRYEMRLLRNRKGAVKSIVMRRVVTAGGMSDWTERTFSPQWNVLRERQADARDFEEQLLNDGSMILRL